MSRAERNARFTTREATVHGAYLTRHSFVRALIRTPHSRLTRSGVRLTTRATIHAVDDDRRWGTRATHSWSTVLQIAGDGPRSRRGHSTGATRSGRAQREQRQRSLAVNSRDWFGVDRRRRSAVRVGVAAHPTYGKLLRYNERNKREQLLEVSSKRVVVAGRTASRRVTVNADRARVCSRDGVNSHSMCGHRLRRRRRR